jgi:hypothetical protein
MWRVKGRSTVRRKVWLGLEKFLLDSVTLVVGLGKSLPSGNESGSVRSYKNEKCKFI